MDKPAKAVVTVLGVDRKGIIAAVSGILYESNVNILDITQTIVSGMFNMVMLADVSESSCSYQALSEKLSALGAAQGLQIRIQRNEIFEAMYNI